jgi:hypothetical protein
MAKKFTPKGILKFLKDCDDMVELITGKRIKNFVKQGLDLYGDDVKKAAEQMFFGPEAQLDSDNPYQVLGCRPEADALVVKGKYRQLVKRYHPDTGVNPDPKKFQQVVEAYNAIEEARRNTRRS